MTIRDYLAMRLRRASTGFFVGFGLFTVGAVIGGQFSRVLLAVGLAGFAISGFSILYMQFIKCPRCQNRLGRIVGAVNPFSVSPLLRYCPFCAVEFDSQIEA